MHHFFFGGVADAPFADGFDAFCFGGASFLGLRTSLPFGISISFDVERELKLTARVRLRSAILRKP
jgi:hypothetical protein